MAMQRKRGRYAKTARPYGMQRQSRLFHHDVTRRGIPTENPQENILLPNLSELYQSPKDRPLIMPIITVKEPSPSLSGTPAPWSKKGSHFEFPPYSYVHGDYQKRTGERKIRIRTSPSLERSAPCSLTALDEDPVEGHSGEVEDSLYDEEMSDSEFNQLLETNVDDNIDEQTDDNINEEKDENITITYRTDYV